MQTLLNKARQHLKWQPQKSWTFFQGFQAVQDKQQMQDPLFRRMRQRFWKFQSQNVQIFGNVYQNTSGPNHGPVLKTQSFLSKGICTVTLWQDYYGKVLLEHGWEVFNWECLFVNRARGLFLSVYVDDINLAGKTENTEPTWKILLEDVDLGKPTSFLDHVYLGCTQRECQISKDIVANYRDVIESRISAWAKTIDQSFRETCCRNNILLVLWHGRPREEMCVKILRTCNTMHGWPPI